MHWLLAGALYAFFYWSRLNLAAVAQAVGEKLGWGHGEYGKLVSAALLFYAFSVIFVGPAVARIGARKSLLVGAVGAALFNLAFGLSALLVGKPAVWKDGKVVTAAVFSRGMSASTVMAALIVVWALNHSFQAIGVMPLARMSAGLAELRAKTGGGAAALARVGWSFAFYFSPLILRFADWKYAFIVPALLVAVVLALGGRVAARAEAEGISDQPGEPPGVILRRIAASPAGWCALAAAVCLGLVQHAIEAWWARAFAASFKLSAAQLPTFAPYAMVSWGAPLFAAAGVVLAGFSVEKWLGGRRGPVLLGAFFGQALALYSLSQTMAKPWPTALALLFVALFVGAALAMLPGVVDLGSRDARATGAAIFEGATWLAAALVGVGIGELLEGLKDPKLPGAEFSTWPLLPLGFAVIGAIFVLPLWAVGNRDATARARMLRTVHAIERIALGAWALVAGATSVIAIILPNLLAKELYAKSLPPPAVVWSQLAGGARLGLALVAMTAAYAPRPPKGLVRAITIGLLASVIGPLFSAMTQGLAWAEIQSLERGFILDGALALLLIATTVMRANLATPSAAELGADEAA